MEVMELVKGNHLIFGNPDFKPYEYGSNRRNLVNFSKSTPNLYSSLSPSKHGFNRLHIVSASKFFSGGQNAREDKSKETGSHMEDQAKQAAETVKEYGSSIAGKASEMARDAGRRTESRVKSTLEEGVEKAKVEADEVKEKAKEVAAETLTGKVIGEMEASGMETIGEKAKHAVQDVWNAAKETTQRSKTPSWAKLKKLKRQSTTLKKSKR